MRHAARFGIFAALAFAAAGCSNSTATTGGTDSATSTGASDSTDGSDSSSDNGASTGSGGASTGTTAAASTTGSGGASTGTTAAASTTGTAAASTSTSSSTTTGTTSTATSTSSTTGTTSTSTSTGTTTTTTTTGTSGSSCGSCNAGFSCDAASGLCKDSSGVPQFSHVWVVILENTNYSSINSGNAPYLTGTLYGQGVKMTNFFAVTHPSLPNYIALVGGDNFGITNDGQASSSTYQVAASHPDIASQLMSAGLSWHEYSESQKTSCALSDTGSDATGKFVSKHDPMPHYLITQNDPSCAQDDVSFEAEGSMPGLAADVSAGRYFNYNFIAPNLCDDGHDVCAPISNEVGQQDAWLSAQLPTILNSSAFADNGVVFVTWDEDDDTGGTNQIATVILSPMLASPGSTNNTHYTHYSTLATIEAGFGLANLPSANGHHDALITDIWK